MQTETRFTSTIHDVTVLKFPKISDPRGNLTFVEQERHIPFTISRAYWIYDVPGGGKRGGHAYKNQKECIIALSGSFDVYLDDGTTQKIVAMNRAYYGLFIPSMIWRRMQNFSTNAVAFVLASHPYDQNDYVYDYEKYKIMNQTGP